jgi:quinoprotein glucose dehydrogenase
VINDKGERLAAPSRGAIFRCDDDGSNFEVYAHGLRNPQEIAFDEYGNLFTFDNTGDFGDKARVVYVLDNTDSGWNADYQSHHQHVTYLDWGDFHLWQSMWVGESMFDLYKETSPQWVYPPIGHVGNGPSGVTYMTGPAVPDSLRGKFLMCNYRGSPTRSEVLAIPIESKGAGFSVGEVTPFISGLNASDVELAYDGKVYLVEFGSGWSPDDKGSVQVAHLKDQNLTKAGDAVARLFEQGFKQRSIDELRNLLTHSDQRVRQSAQFALVEKGDLVLPHFKKIISAAKPDE